MRRGAVRHTLTEGGLGVEYQVTFRPLIYSDQVARCYCCCLSWEPINPILVGSHCWFFIDQPTNALITNLDNVETITTLESKSGLFLFCLIKTKTSLGIVFPIAL